MSTLEPPSGVKKPGGFALWLARLQMDPAVSAAVPDRL